jgi:hypothetical protein
LDIVLCVLFLWTLYCLSFFFGHCIVCPFSLDIVLFVLFRFTASDYSLWYRLAFLYEINRKYLIQYIQRVSGITVIWYPHSQTFGKSYICLSEMVLRFNKVHCFRNCKLQPF